jgi:hypothetical protein
MASRGRRCLRRGGGSGRCGGGQPGFAVFERAAGVDPGGVPPSSSETGQGRGSGARSRPPRRRPGPTAAGQHQALASGTAARTRAGPRAAASAAPTRRRDVALHVVGAGGEVEHHGARALGQPGLQRGHRAQQDRFLGRRHREARVAALAEGWPAHRRAHAPPSPSAPATRRSCGRARHRRRQHDARAAHRRAVVGLLHQLAARRAAKARQVAGAYSSGVRTSKR